VLVTSTKLTYVELDNIEIVDLWRVHYPGF